MKPEELQLDDHRVQTIQKDLVRDAKITRVFRVKDEFQRTKYEVHYFDPKNGLCRTFMACRGREGGRS